MVRLYKTPTDFGICKLRDSFLRQFLDPEDLVTASLPRDPFTLNPPRNSVPVPGYNPQFAMQVPIKSGYDVTVGQGVRRDVRGGRMVETLCRNRFKSSGLPLQRKPLIRNLIRYTSLSKKIWLCKASQLDILFLMFFTQWFEWAASIERRHTTGCDIWIEVDTRQT